MTTEVAILNKSAVALASDSAVTIQRQEPDGQLTTKIYVDANKLFELIKGVPVGVMIYNGAEIGGIPWETLVKVYRSKNRLQRFDTLVEYVNHFLAFVESAVPAAVGTAGEEELAHGLLASIFFDIYNSVQPALIVEPNKLKRRKIFADALDQIDSQMNTLPVQDWGATLDEAQLRRRWQADVASRVPTDMPDIRLSAPLRRRLAQLILRILVRFPHKSGPWSGVVVSGFGEEEVFPGLYHCVVSGVFEGRLVRVDESHDGIDSNRPAIIRPYAQTSEALMFLQGIDPTVSNAISTYWKTWAEELHKQFADIAKTEIPTATTDQIKEVRTKTRNFVNGSWSAFSDYMDQQFHRRRMEPIEASAGFLSKREIAELAEHLVEFTSLRNRVSLDRQETVGGATDVAVISKGDGFVWVKRKHYFDQEHNPNWGLQAAVADVVSKLDVMTLSGATS